MYPSIAMALNLGPDTTRIVGYEDYDIKNFGCRKGHLVSEDVMTLVIPDKVIEKNVIIKKHCIIGNHVTICSNTTIGKECKIFHCSSIGEIPQDLDFSK